MCTLANALNSDGHVEYCREVAAPRPQNQTIMRINVGQGIHKIYVSYIDNDKNASYSGGKM